MINDHTPGFPSAARFVSLAFAGVNLDNRALPGVYLGVVMGRHAGFLTAASSLCRAYPDDGPHLVYVPERTFHIDRFMADVERVYAQHGRCVVALSEGVVDEEGKQIALKLLEKLGREIETDDHGNPLLSGGALADALVDTIKKNTSIKRVRGDTFGYLQRSFMGVVSDVDQHEAREVGEKAVQYALWHDVDGSVTIHRTGNYSVDYQLSRLEDIGGKTKYMPEEFINAEGNDVTPAFYAYGRPLLGSGMPTPRRIRAPMVPKILA